MTSFNPGLRNVMTAMCVFSLSAFLSLGIIQQQSLSAPQQISQTPSTAPQATYRRSGWKEDESWEEKIREWASVIVVPVVLAVGGVFINSRVEKRRRDEAKERYRQEALKSYLDRMTALLVDKGLGEAEHGSYIARVAQALTVTVLRELAGDEERRNQVTDFLSDAGLIQPRNLGEEEIKQKAYKLWKEAGEPSGRDGEFWSCAEEKLQIERGGPGLAIEGPVLLKDSRLMQVDLQKISLLRANLQFSNFSEANLNGANLRLANLVHADLSGTNLNNANLANADLSGANLTGANLGGAHLENILYDEFTKWPSNFTPPPSRNGDSFLSRATS